MLINLFLWGFLLSHIYKGYYPDEYDTFKNKIITNFNAIINKINNYAINIFYNILYIYSIIQIKAIKIKQIVYPYCRIVYEIVNEILIENNIIKNASANSKTIISFYSNGDLLKLTEYSTNCNQIFTSNLVKPDNCDLITIEDHCINESSQINITCVHNISDIINFAASNVKFLSFECKYNNNYYNIALKTSKFNFYMNETIIDKHFIKYYLKNILSYTYEINDSEFSYTLNLIDQNVNCHILTELDNIIIKKDDYILNKYIKIDNKEEVDKEELDNKEEEKHKRTLSDEKDWVISEKTIY
jgi:hypothetical protein